MLQRLNQMERPLTPPPQFEVVPPQPDPTVKEENRLPPPPVRAESEEDSDVVKGPDPSQSPVLDISGMMNQMWSLRSAVDAIYFQHGAKPVTPNPPPPSPARAGSEEDSDEGGPDPSQSQALGLSTGIGQLQNLKSEVEAEQNRRYPQHGSKPVSPSPPSTLTWPPGPPLRAYPPSEYQLQPPPPSPQQSGRTRQAGETSRLGTAPEYTYRGSRPSIPKLTRSDPGTFARLKIALETLLPPDSTETFKYQILLDHLQLEEAKMIADAYLHSTTPYSSTMKALNNRLGHQPYQLITNVMETIDICRGDAAGFARYAMQVQSLVGILKTLGPHGAVELQCGSHVARLLSKLPAEQRVKFCRYMHKRSGQTPTLEDLAEWLEEEYLCQDFVGLATPRSTKEKPDARSSKRSITVHGAKGPAKPPDGNPNKAKQQHYCAYCDNRKHHLSQCQDIAKLSQEQLTDWIKTNKRCWRCARSHLAAQCTLKKRCNLCQGRHLQVLHQVNSKTPKAPVPATVAAREGEQPTKVLYPDRPTEGGCILLKAPDDHLCWICMDSPIDCVLLECGHMITCTQCGKRMSQCPICRQYVVHAVHVFKS